jgi:spore maturation protein CgeB
VLGDPALAASLAERGRRTILARHTCAHRADELLASSPGAHRARELGSDPHLRRAARMNIAFFGSSLVSAYWNGAATYYRGIVRALHERGHRVTFYEPDAYGRQQHRDIADPTGRASSSTRAIGRGRACTAARRGARRGPHRQGERRRRVRRAARGEVLEPPARPGRSSRSGTWTRRRRSTACTSRTRPTRSAPLVPRYDVVLTYGGGDPVVAAYALGARACVPDLQRARPVDAHPRRADPRFTADLAFLGNRLPDREARVEEFFLAPRLAPGARFLLGGNGWHDKPMPPNVRYLGHVYTHDHNAFNCSPARGAQRQPREHGPLRLLAGHARVRGRRRGRVPHHRRVGGGRRSSSSRTARSSSRASGAEVRRMSSRSLSFVFLGLSITSSWGNGHATTYRGLLRELAKRGHRIAVSGARRAVVPR